MKLSEVSPEQLKIFHTIVQQKVMFTNAHQKGSQALAHFELEIANDDRPICIDDSDRKKTRKALREIVRMAAEGLKFVNQLEVG